MDKANRGKLMIMLQDLNTYFECLCIELFSTFFGVIFSITDTGIKILNVCVRILLEIVDCHGYCDIVSRF